MSLTISEVRQWSKWYQISETLILWELALVVGLTTGVGMWVFKRLIVLTYQIMYTWLGAMLS